MIYVKQAVTKLGRFQNLTPIMLVSANFVGTSIIGVKWPESEFWHAIRLY